MSGNRPRPRGARRRGAAPLLAVALLLGGYGGARAEVQGSPHDLSPHGYAAARRGGRQDSCGRCHIPSGQSGPNLLRLVPPSLSAYPPSALLCFSCHDGTTFVSPEVDASATAFHPRSHPLVLAPEETAPIAAALPLSGEGRLECLTCHDPHANTYRPFLRTSIVELCVTCHLGKTGRAAGEENLAGNHPERLDPSLKERLAVPISIEAPFRVPFPEAYPVAGGSVHPGAHWNLGGHLSRGGAGEMVCISCHAVHGDESVGPLADLLSADPGLETADLFCEGCHAGTRADERPSPPRPNPGGTLAARTYHPGDNDLSNGEGALVETRLPQSWPLGTGAPRAILCSTCHRAHDAVPRSLLLRQPTPETGFCEECHEQMPLEHHHPIVGDGAGPCEDKLTLIDPITGLRRGCDFCHRAHNAGLGTGREPEYVPLLRERLLADEQCLGCHPKDNPTCGKEPERRASHFLGDSTLPETYGNLDPPLRLEAWPESRLFSAYGGERAQAVTCLSCHSFRPGALVSGDDGKQKYLLARSGNPIEWEESEGVYLCTGCHSANPGTGTTEKGHTHPLMNAKIEFLGRAPEAPVTATPNGRVNCDSCHRPHGARTEGGYYILEKLEGVNADPLVVHPKIDFTVLCHGCHETGKY